jgi:hypothetical protein
LYSWPPLEYVRCIAPKWGSWGRGRGREGGKYGSTALTVFIQMNKYQIPYNSNTTSGTNKK